MELALKPRPASDLDSSCLRFLHAAGIRGIGYHTWLIEGISYSKTLCWVKVTGHSVKYLLWKCEDLSSISSTHQEAGVGDISSSLELAAQPA